MIPVIILGICVGFIIKMSMSSSQSPQTSFKDAKIEVRGVVDLTPHLTEFTQLIRSGHRPNRWLVTEAISEAYDIGDWELVRAISDNYTDKIPQYKRKKKEVVKKKEEPEEKVEEIEEMGEKAPLFLVQKTTSPIEGVPDDDWRMFVEVSKVESPDFISTSSIGMFRQNKKRLAKLGLPEDSLKDPIAQYDAFEKEVIKLMNEGKEVFDQSVAMPIDLEGDSTAMTLSGLLAVMRNAGTANTSKWIDSPDERRKFPHTTEAFKKANGCF